MDTGPAQFATIAEMVEMARASLRREVWDYLDGGADSEATLRSNRAAFDRYRLMPRILRDVRQIDLSTTIMGRPSALPFFTTAIGSLDLLHPDGAAGSARAAVSLGGTSCVGLLARPHFDQIAASAAGPLMLQLYIRGDDDWLREVLHQAEAAGYYGIQVTVDSPVYGRRERDLVNRFSSRSTPDRPAIAGTSEVPQAEHQAAFDWARLDRLRAMTKLPLGLKGVMHPDDAVRAVNSGIDCIYVSNHGGRQLDCAPATIDQLPIIAAAVAGRAEIVVDSGIMRGTDVIKCFALGASAVGLGKLQGYALAAGGTNGVRRMLELLAEEVRASMALVGATRMSDLGAEHLG